MDKPLINRAALLFIKPFHWIVFSEREEFITETTDIAEAAFINYRIMNGLKTSPPSIIPKKRPGRPKGAKNKKPPKHTLVKLKLLEGKKVND